MGEPQGRTDRGYVWYGINSNLSCALAGMCARVCASHIACASATVRVVVDPLVVSSDHTDCDRIDGNGGLSSPCCCCCCEPYNPNE
jgi:hypothetical protein